MNYDQLSQLDAGTKIKVKWPSTGETTVVDYRGRMGNTAFVWTGTLQVSIAPEMIVGVSDE